MASMVLWGRHSLLWEREEQLDLRGNLEHTRARVHSVQMACKVQLDREDSRERTMGEVPVERLVLQDAMVHLGCKER